MPKTLSIRALGACALLLPALACADVFINEIHYDDAGADLGEAIEVVATAGETLTDYQIVLYNGSNSQTYDTDVLPVGSVVSCGGGSPRFGVINYPLDGLQNGAPDGIALVRVSDSAVIQFLSYEGVINAANGPAVGTASIDIVVSEPGTTTEGTSLQLGGSGSAYANFAWNASATATFGTCNNGQTFAPPVDNPPTVASSNPAHNATDVAFDTAITVTFSEPVDATGTWFTFNCGSGTPTLTSSASPATTFTLTPSAPIGYSKLCTLTVIAAQISDRDSPIDVMEFNDPIQFETEADDPPFVVTTVPDDNQANVARAADLLVTFSEPVNAPASAFGIFCPDNAVTSLPFALSSDDDTNFVLNPTNDLPAGTACRLYVDNLQVTDQDAVAQNPDADTRVNFTTAALAAPTVISTFPADDATNFPSAGDLQATFDTSVTLTSGAFTLSCTQSTGIALTHAMSGSSFVIDTGTALVPGDACTFTIVAANVISGDGLNPAQNEVVTFTVFDSASTDAYYQNVNLSSDAQLLCSLYDTINGHNKLSYSYSVLNLADEDPADNTKILDVYKNASYTKYTSGDATHNREHTWPRTYGLGETSSPGSATDYHMLHLTDTAYNSDRGSKPLGNCDSGCVQRTTIVNQGQGGSGNAQSNWYSTTGSSATNPLACPSQGNTENCKTYEVWDWRKGDIARAVMYMAIRYKGEGGEANLELTDDRTLITSGGSGGKHYMGLLTHILAWNQADLPTEAERDRNQIVQSFQNNRNPFTDHPEWARPGIFTASLTSPCVLNTQAPAANDDSYSTPLNTALTAAANVGVLANDLDAEGAPLYAELVTTVSSGTLALAANGGFTYTPAASFCGSTSFTYRASDGVRLSAPRTATINIGAPCGGGNQPPVANDATFALPENSVASTVVGTVVASDPDVGTTLSYQITGGNGAGAFAMSGNQVVVANAAPLDFETTEQFVLTVTVSDGAAPTPATDTATITVNLSDVNDAPTIAQSLPNRTAEEGVAIAPFSIANGFADADAGSDLDFSAGNLPSGLVLDSESGQISGTPAIGTAGIATVTITASDGALTAQQTFQFTIAAAGVPIFADGFEE